MTGAIGNLPDYDGLREQAARLREARNATVAAQHEMAEAIRAALDLNAPVIDVARAAGVTRARVYQIRDGRR